MITNIELNDAGLNKFNTWFFGIAKPNVRVEAVLFEMLNIMENRFNSGESRVYELGHIYTSTGRPELLRLDDADFVVTKE